MAEFTLIIALGSAVGDPMIYADVPLLHGMVALTLMVIFQRLFTYWTIHSQQMRRVFEGEAIRLVKDGALDMMGIQRAHMSTKEIFAELRQGGAKDLREVKRAYLETDGQVSVFLYDAQPLTLHAQPFSLMLDGDNDTDRPASFAEVLQRCPHCSLALLAALDTEQITCPNCQTTVPMATSTK